MPHSTCAPSTAQNSGIDPSSREAAADQRQPDQHREPARVDVGNRAGGNFEQQDGHLQHGAHQHHLQRIQAYRLHLVDQIDREDQSVKKRPPAAYDKIDTGRILFEQGDSSPCARGVGPGNMVSALSPGWAAVRQ